MTGHPGFCCQTCGNQIGYVGRFLLRIGLPMWRLYPSCRNWGKCR